MDKISVDLGGKVCIAKEDISPTVRVILRWGTNLCTVIIQEIAKLLNLVSN